MVYAAWLVSRRSTRPSILRLGAALVRVLPHQGPPPPVVGRDTRESGDWIEHALARGVAPWAATW